MITTLTKHTLGSNQILSRKNIFALFLLCTGILQNLNAQCDLFCNDLVHIPISIDGFAVVTPDNILEDSSACPGPKQVDIFVAGTSIGDTVRCHLVGRTLMVTVTDSVTQNACMGEIRVQDISGPVISCRDTTVACGTPADPNQLGFPAFMDNCDNNPDIFYADSIVDLTCTGGPFNTIIYRTWSGRDNRNNRSVPCTQRIFFTTPQLSNVVFPPDTVIDCSAPNTDPAVTGQATVDNMAIGTNCKFSVDFTDSRIDICPDSYKILRRWRVLDCCSNVDTTGLQFITVMDNTAPDITCPDSIFIETSNGLCSASFVLDSFPVVDDCSAAVDVSIQYPGGSLNTNGGIIFNLPQGTNNLEVTATDACGNDTTCQVVVVVSDIQPPTPVCNEFLVVNINSSGIACVPVSSIDAGTTDNCCLDSMAVRRMDSPDPNFYSEVCFDCRDVGQSVVIITRFWDCFGNFNDCMTEVRPQDKIAPQIFCPDDITILCSQDYRDTSITGGPALIDNCDSLLLAFSDDTTGLDMCNTGTVVRTWKVTDAAGRMDICTQNIRLIDTTPAVIIFPPDTTLMCPVDFDNLDAGDVQIVDDCSLPGYAVAVDDAPPFRGNCFIKILRTYTVLNWCTLEEIEHVQEIKIIDEDAPDWDQQPGDLDTTITCDNTVDVPRPTATDGCSDTVNIVEVFRDTFPGTCPNEFTIRAGYVADDGCMNFSDTLTVTVLIVDTVPPVFIGVPADTVIGCDQGINELNVSAVDNCGAVVLPPPVVDTLPASCPEVGVFRFSWTASDACGNTATATFTLTLIDTVPPTSAAIPDSTYQCPEEIPDPDIAVVTGLMDNCDTSISVSLFRNDTVEMRCLDTLIRIYELSDGCGNAREVQQRYFLQDTVPPRLTCPTVPYDTGIASILCEVFIDSIIGRAIDNCANASIAISNNSIYADSSGANAAGTYPLGNHSFYFFAEDECLNRDSCLVEFQVRDALPPSVRCFISGIIMLDSFGIAVRTPRELLGPNNEPKDSCSETIIVLADRDTFTCDDVGGIDTVNITVIDGFNNSSTCEVYWVVTDPTMACSGSIPPPLLRPHIGGYAMDPKRHTIHNMEVSLSAGGYTKKKFTGQQDGFLFLKALDSIPVLPGTETFATPVELFLSKNNDPLNGVTTFDLAMISRHIIGLQPFTKVEQFIAADVNNSGTITVSDIVEVRKMILGKQAEFSNSESWRFIPADLQFAHPADALTAAIPDRMVLLNKSDADYSLAFLGIKIGDINGNAQAGNLQPTVSARQNPKRFNFQIENINFKAGQLVEVPVLMQEPTPIAGFQVALKFNPSVFQFTGYQPNAASRMTDENFNFSHLEAGILKISWNGISNPAATLLTLQFKARQSGTLRNNLKVLPDLLTPEVYTAAMEIRPLTLVFGDEAPARTNNSLQLFQNEPNPFSGNTVVGFSLPEQMAATLDVMDVSGAVIYTVSNRYDAGSHRVVIGPGQLPGAGIYFYRLSSPAGVLSRRMLLVR